MFRIGQKVVCVCAPAYERPGEPPNGSVSTVSNVYKNAVDDLCLELEEWPSPEDSEHFPGWLARFFRPVIERKTDIGMAILEEIRKRESVPADEKQRVGP
jgi:hypothetical protein